MPPPLLRVLAHQIPTVLIATTSLPVIQFGRIVLTHKLVDLERFDIPGITSHEDARKNAGKVMAAIFDMNEIRRICKKNKLEFANR